VPKTWKELTETAQIVQDGERKAGNDKMWGFVWQGRAYEGLTCDALEWIYSYGGGTIIDAKGEVTVNNRKAAAALKLAQSWVNTITPPGVLNYAEEDSRGVWQTGNAVFMRNWSYAWALSQSADSPIKDKVGVAALPRGDDGPVTGTIGGWNMAVSAYSKHPEIAASYALFLTSRDSQRIRAVKYSQNPNFMALYDEPDVVGSNPILGNLKGLLQTAVARPSRIVGPNYARVSAEFFNGVHAILSGAPVEAKLAEMESAIRRAARGR
jgi:trehalose/maltose transport system substrate-binding protein